MITCTYCGYECPDNAYICPNCGKPLIRPLTDKSPTFDSIREALRREKDGIKEAELHSQKKTIIAACVVLLIALFIFKYYLG